MPPSYPAEIPSSPISAHSDDFSSDDSDTSNTDYHPSMDESDSQDTSSDLEEEFMSTAQHLSLPAAGSSQLLPNASASMITCSSAPAPSQALIRLMLHFQVMASSKEELWEHIQQIYTQNKTLTEAIAMQTVQVNTVNAHCTIAQRENQDWCVKAENKRRKKTCTSTKVKACYVTALEFKESFEVGADARKEKERLEKDKKDKKKLDEEAHIAHIHNNIMTRTFNSPFMSYKQKEDLEALTGALGLLRDGKIVDLAARIKFHLEDPDTCTALADNP